MTTRPTMRLSQYDEIVVRVAPSGRPAGLGEASETRAPFNNRVIRHYHAWVYAGIALPVELGQVGPPERGGVSPPPPEVGGLPLIGHEELYVVWRSYGEYLSTFYEGERAILKLRDRMTKSISRGLKQILGLRPREPRRLRIWWSTESPELEDLPWELIALGEQRPSGLSIVRGTPGKATPPLPLSEGHPLRVAVIDPTRGAPIVLWNALKNPGVGIEVVWIEQSDPRKALREATRMGVEMIHVVADGSVPLGLEGLLEFSGEAGDEDVALSASEVEALLRGSSVTILSLTPTDVPHVGCFGMPTVFHAFARFGHDSSSGPTIVAPLGPMPPGVDYEFWREFYRQIAVTFDVEDAVVRAARDPLVTPVVLFLRHRLGRQFSQLAEGARPSGSWPTHGTGQSPADVAPLTPPQVTADLHVSRDLLDAATTLQARYALLGRDFPGDQIIEEERRRQAALSDALDDALSEESDT